MATDLAIDRFRLSGDLEEQARDIAASFRFKPDRNLLLGYLESSVAMALERPRWKNRDRLAVDLRVVQLLQEKP